MPTPFPSRRQILAFAALAPRAVAAGFWEQKPHIQWSKDEARELLIDSPWSIPFRTNLVWEKAPPAEITYKDVPGTTPGPARSNTTVSGGSPVGGLGAPKLKLPTEADLILRWASALPIRQATAILRFDNPQSAEARELIAEQPAAYILEIFGLPAIVGHKGTGALAAIVKQETVLQTKSGRQLRPKAVEASVRGLHAHVEIHFSRQEPLTLEDRHLEVFSETGLFQFRQRFDLRKMSRDGELQL